MTLTHKQKSDAVRKWLGTGSINIFGRPFAGKDTQGTILADQLGGVLLSGGHILRSTASRPEIQAVLAKGLLPVKKDYIEIVAPHFYKEEYADKPLILSSFGRCHGEEEPILQTAKDSNHPLRAVVALELSEEEVRERLKAVDQAREHDAGNKRVKRADDTHAALDTRLDEFRNKTLPVLQFYHDKGMLIRVDGTQTPEMVTQDIMHALYMMSLGE